MPEQGNSPRRASGLPLLLMGSSIGIVPIRLLHPGQTVPSRAHPGDAGVDLESADDA